MNECWYHHRDTFVSGGDLALLFLKDPKPEAVQYVDFVDVWNEDEGADGPIESGTQFALMGWGLAGEESDYYDYGDDLLIYGEFHRGYNQVSYIWKNEL